MEIKLVLSPILDNEAGASLLVVEGIKNEKYKRTKTTTPKRKEV